MKLDVVHNKSCQSMSELTNDSIDLIATDPPFGISFMNRQWDRAIPSVDIWRECLRVLKPGAFAFVMCIPRQDCLMRMIGSLEETGFNVSFTSMYHCFSSGFPKAQNVSLTIDKKECRRQLERKLGRKPTKEEFNKVWEGFRKVEGSKIGQPGYSLAPGRGRNILNSANDGSLNDSVKECQVTLPTTPQAQALNGSFSGFQPKPAVEVILVAMKPLSEKTYVDQALKNGKGVTWLDEGRIPYKGQDSIIAKNPHTHRGNNRLYSDIYGEYRASDYSLPAGRFPANLLVSDDALNDGKVTKSMGGIGMGKLGKRIYGKFENATIAANTGGCGDSGSFSRYFSLDAWFAKKLTELPKGVQRTFPFLIVPKASKAEKNRGCEGLGRKKKYSDFGLKERVENGRTTNPRTNIEASGTRNNHPTCKPIKLMSYLITLGSREDDIVLDPFIGSGTTAIAAKMLRRHYIGYEIDPEYCRIAEARLSAIEPRLI